MLHTDPNTFSTLLTDPAFLAAVCGEGSAPVGDLSAVNRLLRSVSEPSSAVADD